MMLNRAGQDLVAIDTFVRQNAHAAACLALRFDAGHLALPADEFPIGTWSSSYVHEQQQIYAVCMRQCILGTSPTANMGALLVGLSDIYAWETGLEKDTWPAAARWVPPARFQRETTKFWLQPDNIMRFKAEMIKHVPILIFNERPGLTGKTEQGTEGVVGCLLEHHRLTRMQARVAAHLEQSHTCMSAHSRLDLCANLEESRKMHT